jgi:hypothetical protein
MVETFTEPAVVVAAVHRLRSPGRSPPTTTACVPPRPGNQGDHPKHARDTSSRQRRWAQNQRTLPAWRRSSWPTLDSQARRHRSGHVHPALAWRIPRGQSACSSRAIARLCSGGDRQPTQVGTTAPLADRRRTRSTRPVGEYRWRPR